MKRLGLRQLGMLVVVSSFVGLLFLVACSKSSRIEARAAPAAAAPAPTAPPAAAPVPAAPAPAVRAPAARLPADGAEAAFPWPAPKPSAYYKLPRNLLGSARNFGEVADGLELALNQAGYTENKFYSLKNNGFAVVTRIESIRSNGSCRPASQRWVVDSPSLFTLKDYLAALFGAHKGFYRVWAFAVTSLPEGFTGPAPTQQQIDELFSRGEVILPPPLRTLPFTSDYYCLALVYQFERKDVPPPLLRVPSNLTGVQHLTAATILQHLEH